MRGCQHLNSGTVKLCTIRNILMLFGRIVQNVACRNDKFVIHVLTKFIEQANAAFSCRSDSSAFLNFSGFMQLLENMFS